MLKNKELEREISNVRVLLHHAQTALANETHLRSSVLRECTNYDTEYDDARSKKALSASRQRFRQHSLTPIDGDDRDLFIQSRRQIPMPAIDLFDNPKSLSVFREPAKENAAPLKVEDLEQPVPFNLPDSTITRPLVEAHRMVVEESNPQWKSAAFAKTDQQGLKVVDPDTSAPSLKAPFEAFSGTTVDSIVKAKVTDRASSIASDDGAPFPPAATWTAKGSTLNAFELSNAQRVNADDVDGKEISNELRQSSDSIALIEEPNVPAIKEKADESAKATVLDEFAAIEAEPELQKYLQLASAAKQQNEMQGIEEGEGQLSAKNQAEKYYASSLDDFEGATESSGGMR